MDKNVAGIIGAVTSLAAAVPAYAAAQAPRPAEVVLAASSYADLLKPIPNAREHLAALNAVASDAVEASPGEIQEVQYYNYVRPYYPPGYYPPAYYPPYYPRPYFYHHHHHHHHYHHHHHHHHHWHRR